MKKENIDKKNIAELVKVRGCTIPDLPRIKKLTGILPKKCHLK